MKKLLLAAIVLWGSLSTAAEDLPEPQVLMMYEIDITLGENRFKDILVINSSASRFEHSSLVYELEGSMTVPGVFSVPIVGGEAREVLWNGGLQNLSFSIEVDEGDGLKKYFYSANIYHCSLMYSGCDSFEGVMRPEDRSFEAPFTARKIVGVEYETD